MPVPSFAPNVSRDTGVQTLDLSEEAARIFRNRRSSALLGLGIGAVFAAIGAVELVLLGIAAFSANTVIAAFLVVLGGSIAWFSYRGGLWDPVARIDLAEEAATFSKRSGRSVRIAWSDPAWDLEIRDPALDPSIRPEEKDHLFFVGAAGVYGTLSRSHLGPILDATRARGLSVTIREVAVGRRKEHTVRQIRIRPPGRGGPTPAVSRG